MTRTVQNASHKNVAAAELPAGGALVIAFGTSVALAWVSYVAHLPHVRWAAAVTLPAIGAILIAGAAFAGMTSARPLLTGALSGLFSGAINLIVFGSLLGAAEAADTSKLPSPMIRMLGFLLLSIAMGGIGATFGAHGFRRRVVARDEWCRGFGWVAVGATFFLLILGGIVTSEEAGLAVPDWPNTFGSNMVLFPLVRMLSQSDVYYEHAHRLFATLVGLTTVGLAVFLICYDRRALVRGLALAAVGAVVLQGVLGGLRVVWVSDALRVVHGVLAQLFFALMVCLTAVLAPSWRVESSGDAGRDVCDRLASCRWLAVWVTSAILWQHLFGALVRHIDRDRFVLIHLGFAFVVLGLGIFFSVRLRVIRRASAELPPLARAILKSAARFALLLVAQMALGFFTFVATGGADNLLSTLTATTHQVFGALVLASGAQLTARLWRIRALGSGREGPVEAVKPGFDAVDKLSRIS